MTVRQTRQLLNALAAICAAACVGVVFWTFMEPALPEPDTPRIRQPVKTGAKTTDATVSDEDLLAIADRSLQGSRTVQKVVRPTAPPRKQRRTPPAVTAPRISLLATVFDEKSKIAILQDVRGLTDQKRVGEPLNLLPSGMTLEAIEADHVRVALRGRTFQIGLKGQSTSPQASPRRLNKGKDADDDDESPDMSEFNEEPTYVGEERGMMKR